ncbi:DUF4270 domain-containing protein [Flavobacterium sp. RHBU_3]|uniref:DUF4270 domain-containing protein n=1 Tax=Flavobacterium sp. RHBU_3 TaxID=3391184 RepID=UPI0039851E4F
MKKFSFLKNLLFAFAAVAAVVACDDEYSELGSDMVNGDIHNTLNRTYAQVVAYDRPLGAVQVSGLSVNYLGVLDNDIFGKTTASYITQAQLASVNPAFTSSIEVDSAWVYVPYTSTLTGTETYNDTLRNTYTLSDVYGSTDSTLTYKLDIRRNNYYLRSNDASTGGSDTQYYYSDDDTALLSNQGPSIIAGGAPVDAVITSIPIQRRANFTNDDDVVQHNKVVETLAPGIFQYLDTTFFQTLLNTGKENGSLVNNNVFKDYFRGVSFLAQQVGSNSRIIAPNFTSGYIKVTYNQNDLDSDGNIQYEDDAHTIIKKEHLTLTINLTGTHVNILQNENMDGFLQKVNNSDDVNGDDRLYLRGGVGSMAVVKLNQAEIEALGDTAMVNQASLKFYVDQGNLALSDLPARVYLYDIDNKRPVYDYYLDQTTSVNTKASKYVYGGILRDSSGPFYRISLTHHINNLIRRDSTNIRLGLVVTNDITVSSNAMIRTPFTLPAILGVTPPLPEVTVKTTPMANINSPQGVVLYGSNIPAGDPDYDKRLRLEIFYTKKD